MDIVVLWRYYSIISWIFLHIIAHSYANVTNLRRFSRSWGNIVALYQCFDQRLSSECYDEHILWPYFRHKMSSNCCASTKNTGGDYFTNSCISNTIIKILLETVAGFEKSKRTNSDEFSMGKIANLQRKEEKPYLKKYDNLCWLCSCLLDLCHQEDMKNSTKTRERERDLEICEWRYPICLGLFHLL